MLRRMLAQMFLTITRWLLKAEVKSSDFVTLSLVPVEVFGADDGYGLMDAASAWSDCNRAEGRIYRVDDLNPSYRLPGETVQICIKADDRAFFEKRWGLPEEEATKTRNNAVEELLEAIRLTQEYAQHPAVEGWSWYDTYRKYRPKDAERLREYWQRGVDNGAW